MNESVSGNPLFCKACGKLVPFQHHITTPDGIYHPECYYRATAPICFRCGQEARNEAQIRWQDRYFNFHYDCLRRWVPEFCASLDVRVRDE